MTELLDWRRRAQSDLSDWAVVVRAAGLPHPLKPEATMDADDSAAAEAWATVEAFNRAFAANDPDGYFALVDEAVTVLVPGSPYRVEGKAADREGFEHGLRAGYSRVHFFQALQPRVQVFGSTAVVTYYTRGRYGPPGADHAAYYKETDVLVRRAEGWKIVHIHVSTVS